MLDYTTKEVAARETLVINPAKICQPIGAILAYKGIHNCMPLTHGSQGCSSYLRMMLARHYREPTIAATSSFTEDSVVFGGRNNLREAVDNIVNIYHPDVLAIHTTCSSETIGDDVSSFMEEIKEEEFFDSKRSCGHSQHPKLRGIAHNGLRQRSEGHGPVIPEEDQAQRKTERHPRFC